MIIMAQHPQKQQTHQASNQNVSENKASNNRETKPYETPSRNGKIFATPVSMAIITNGAEKINRIDARSHLNTAYNDRHQKAQYQDGKRTLIKNQLYLIEQLQLENANLRNERDQLQLENEELKFQLQMISSSNILGQSGTAFNDDRQIDRLAENDSGGAATSIANHNSTVIDNLPARQRAGNRPSSCVPPLTAASAAAAADNSRLATASTVDLSNSHYDHYHHHQPVTSASGLAKLTATPLRHPSRPAAQQLNGLQANHVGEASVQNSVKSNINLESSRRLPVGASNEFDASLYTKAQLAASGTAACGQEGAPSNNRFFSAKSTSLSAFNVRANLMPGPFATAQTDDLLTIDQDEQADEQRRCKLLQQLYGDSEKVHAAAITIQRAFRKYQICKRFRMITEQLRHASKSSPVHLRKQQQQQFINGHNQDESASESNGTSATRNTTQVPFASGATRAAAWESLSQAASRLAASAASATASTKQVFSNGVAKSASCQQVTAASRSHQARHQSRPQSAVSGNVVVVANERSTQSKANSVVAAAINFQQLESIRKRQYRVGLNVFNKNPEKGVSFLIAHSFIDCSPPYTKTSHSYYLSNQLHFIDKQHLAAQQQPMTSGATNTVESKLQNSNCRQCHEEENLKRNVAHFLLHRKGLAKEKIGQYLGNLQCQFNQDVLNYYLQELDFNGLQVDVALRKFSSTMRMPGEAQKIERFVDCFAQRYVQCQQLQQTANDFANANQPIQLSANNGVVRVGNEWAVEVTNQTPDVQAHMSKNNVTLLTNDEIFILTFAIIMLNTDLHSPSLKSTSRMSASQFVNNLRGVFKSQTIDENDLIEIYQRVKANQITTTPDHMTHVMKVQQGLTTNNFQKKELPNLCVPHRRLVCFCRLFEVYDINKKERVGQHQREIFLFNDLLLVTKLSRRPRANTPQQYTYRQSISLQGLYVQLFQSAHYNFGIRLCRRSNDEILIMFNARNELDQSRFVDDLNESIAEMDEMETIRSNNLIDSLHSKHQERLRRHFMLHANSRAPTRDIYELTVPKQVGSEIHENPDNHNHNLVRNTHANEEADMSSSPSSTGANVTVVASSGSRRLSAKFCSMSNLSSVAENEEPGLGVTHGKHVNGLRQNRSFVQQSKQLQVTGQRRQQDVANSGPQRSNSTSSVHSLDSGLYLSRDVSPNQSG